MILYGDEYWNHIQPIIPYIINKENLYGKSILVTGAGGLISSAICDTIFFLNKKYDASIKLFLAARNKEKIESRFYDFSEGKDFYFIQYDATKDFICNEIFDFIIHGASYGDPTGIMKEPVEIMLCNFKGLYSLFDYLRKQKNGRLCYISSSEVYGKKESTSAFIENDYGFVDLLSPRSCYPSSKRATETLCSAFNYEYGVDSVIVRPGHIYGPQITKYDSRVSAEFTRKAKIGQPLVLRSMGKQLRSYTYSLDCASAILSVLLNGKTCNAYNISNKNSVCTIKNFAECMAKNSNVPMEFNITDSKEKENWNVMENSSLNSSFLEKIGWNGIFSLEEGIANTLRFYEVEK